MSANVLDGKAIAGEIRRELRDDVAALVDSGCRPGLGVVMAGDDPVHIPNPLAVVDAVVDRVARRLWSRFSEPERRELDPMRLGRRGGS